MAKFATRTLLVLVLFAVACAVHFIFIALQRAKGLRLSVLGSTVGTLFMVFFISVCSSLLAPFRCNLHPNELSTLQAYHEVLCNGEGEHLSMALIGGFCCILPLTFLVVCSWIILFQLPKWLADGDVKMIRACSFLFIRFRPGAEAFSVVFFIRNALVVICPLIPSVSGRVLSMNLVLYASLIIVAFAKPWRSMLCNVLDIFLVAGLLVILGMGSLFVQVTNDASFSTTVICIAIFVCMFLAIFGSIMYGILKHLLLKYRKPFRFFICHQKNAAGSYARLLKQELQLRGSRFTTFVDCDDLNDLTKLFSYVGQDTETFVILGSPQILTRKWCVGEMVNARLNKVHSVLLTFPGFVKPDASFIRDYATLVPDVSELSNYNIGLQEVEETLRWIGTISMIEVPGLLNPDSIDDVVSGLSGSKTTRTRGSASSEDAGCVIAADLDNMEAAATAFVLLGLIRKKVMTGVAGSVPTVLMKKQTITRDAKSVLLICSEGCFNSRQVAEWLLQVRQAEQCALLPIIAEDGFRFPSQSTYDQLFTNPDLQTLDLEDYVQIIKAVFPEIAVVFSPQNYSSTAEDLELRATQVAWRLSNGLKPLAAKAEKKQSTSEGSQDDNLVCTKVRTVIM